MPNFWNRSFKECLQEFDFVTDIALKKEEENRRSLKNTSKEISKDRLEERLDDWDAL